MWRSGGIWLGNGTSGRLGKPGCGFSSTEVADEFRPDSGRTSGAV